MTWNQPKSIWQWLVFLVPGATSLGMTTFLGGDQIIPGLIIAFLLCIILAFLPVRGSDQLGIRIGGGIICLMLLVILNFTIAIGGCLVLTPI